MLKFNSSEDYFAALRDLIEAWCDRRCLHALCSILGPYIGFGGLTDSWMELNAGLHRVQSQARDELTSDELEILQALIVEAERIVAR